MKGLFSLFFAVLFLFTTGTAVGQTKQLEKINEGLSSVSGMASKAGQYMAEIDSVVDKVEKSDNFKQIVNGLTGKFPYGIKPTNSKNSNYALYIDKLSIDPLKGAIAQVYMKIPFTGKQFLYFMADQVPISQGGSISGDFRLYLLNSPKLSVGTDKGYSLNFKGLESKTADSTYVTINCKGYKDIALNGELEFNPATIVKANESGGNSKQPYILKFHVATDRLENILIDFINVPAFEIPFLPGYTCKADSLTLDYSEIANAKGFTALDEYINSNNKGTGLTAQEVKDGLGVLWKGVCIQNMEITIPTAFSEGSSSLNAKDATTGKTVTKAAVIQVKSLIVDNEGVSGLIQAVGSTTNSNGTTSRSAFIEGNMKGFEYAIDSVRIGLNRNTLSEGAIAGGIVLPISEKDAKNSVTKKGGEVHFSLSMHKNAAGDDMDYAGSVSIPINDTLSVPALNAKMMFTKPVEFAFNYQNKQFFPRVKLAGCIYASLKKGAGADAKSKLALDFAGLVVDSKTPYLYLDDTGKEKSYFKMTGLDNLMSGLPINIQEIGLVSDGANNKTGIHAKINISLQGSKGNDSQSSNGFNASAGFTIWGKQDPGSRKWKYYDFTLETISLSVDQESFSLKGTLERFDGDVVYGTGFCGKIDLKVIKKIDVSAAAIFGKIAKTEKTDTTVAKDGFAYWFVDASVTIPGGILFAPGATINTFTGGLYHHMSMKTGSDAKGSNSTVDCKTASGRSYDPEPKVFLGLLAGIGIQSVGGGTAFNGNINFGIEFNNGGGLNKIATWGDVKFVQLAFKVPGVESVSGKVKGGGSVPKVADTSKTAPADDGDKEASFLWANWFVSYDFPNKTLVGDFSLYINVPIVISGIGPGGRAGYISFFADPKDWYLYCGTPMAPMGVEVISLLRLESYLCLGSILPNPPIAPLPPIFNENGESPIDYSLLNAGSGFSFGARMSMGGDFRLGLGVCSLEAYASYSLGAGFDILLSKSNKPVLCFNDYNRGIHDWYATGQAFIYGDFRVGASYDCWLASGGGDLFVLTAKAYVFAQLPKPSYIKGAVSTEIHVIGKSFGFNIKVEAGDVCESVTPSTNVDFIQSILPSDSSRVGVTEPVIVNFNQKLEDFKYKIDKNTYRKIIADPTNDVQIFAPNGKKIAVRQVLSKDKMKLVITPLEVMPDSSLIQVKVKLSTQVLLGSRWSTILNDTTVDEIGRSKFLTGSEYSTLLVKDVLHAYPLPSMANFYKDETTRGHVKMAVIPKKSVVLAPKESYNVAVFKGTEELGRSNNVTYDGKGRFDFDIPSMRMVNGKTYTLKLMKSLPVDRSTETKTTVEDYTVGTIEKPSRDKVLLSYDFTTSDYNTFVEKMSSYKPTMSQIFNNGVIRSTLSKADVTEPLSNDEGEGYVYNGVKNCEPLVRFGVAVDGNDVSSGNASFEFIDNGDGYELTNTSIASYKKSLTEMNLKCLLDQSCKQENVGEFKVPAGELLIPVGYFPPGFTKPTSTINFKVKLDKEFNSTK